MKFKHPVYVTIYTPAVLAAPQDFFQRIRYRCEHYPELIPEKCGFWEPLKIEFSPDIIETLIPDDRGGAADSLWCKRNKKTRFWGGFSPSYHGRTHSLESIQPELEQVDQDKLINYVKKVSVEFNADLAIIDMNRVQEVHPNFGWIDFTPTTHILKHWLSDMYWGVVFGEAYVNLFGLEILMSTPAYRVEKLSEKAVYIQLSAAVQDVYEQTEVVDQAREKVKVHLGYDAFYSVEKDYEPRSDRRKLIGLSEDNIIWTQMQTDYTDTFRVPHFNLISDAYMQAEAPPENMYLHLNQLKKLQTTSWELELSQWWLSRPFDTSAPGYGETYSHGDVEEIAYFYRPEGYDAPIEKELFIGGWDRIDLDTQSRADYAESTLITLLDHYPAATTVWECLKQSVQHNDDYSVIYLDQVEQQEHNLFRIVTKVIVFEKFLIKVTFMDYWSNSIEESLAISEPIFNSFKTKELSPQ